MVISLRISKSPFWQQFNDDLLISFQKASIVGSVEDAVELKKKRTFRKYTYRGVDLDALLDKST